MKIPDLRARAFDILSTAIDAVHPHKLMMEALELRGTILRISGLDGQELELDLSELNRIVAVGAGKATAPMAVALEELLQARLEGGVISVKYGHTALLERVDVYEAGHPIPDSNGLAATRDILSLLWSLQKDDLAIVLISGGGSALLDAYPDEITLEEAQKTFDILLSCGAPIQDINVVRKHISLVKGGQLARIALPARVVTLVLSDVIGDPLPIIASGPTVPDPSTFQDALNILDKFNVREKIPPGVKTYIERGVAGEIPDTPKESDEEWERCHTFIIGNSRRAVEAASVRATELGLSAHILTTTMEGEAAEVGREMAGILQDTLQKGEPVEPPCCIIAGGETTVTLEGESGDGGRNQELALAAAIELEGVDHAVLLSAGTDGTDGPTDAAGGIVDGGTVQKAMSMNLSAEECLRKHSSYSFLQTAGDLVRTGPTKTNVMDLVLMLACKEE